MIDPEPVERPRGEAAARRSAAAIPTASVQHPLDRQALAALRQVPGLDDIVRFVFEKGFEKIWRIQHLSSAVRVSDHQFPGLYGAWLGCVERLGVSPTPPLYVRTGGMNAFTAGVEEPFVVVTSAMVSCTSDIELEYVLGHELGHIRCEHVLYNTLAWQLPTLAQIVPVVGPFAARAVAVALMEWHRRAELSCDRFGLLANQDLGAAHRVMMKLAGAPYALYGEMNVDAFLAQWDDFEKLDQDRLSYLYKLLAEMQLTHPWLVERAHHLRTWAPEAEALLADAPLASRPRPSNRAPTDWPLPGRACGTCAVPLSPGVAFCEQCGAPAERAMYTRGCSACGASVPLADRYCGACGAPAERGS